MITAEQAGLTAAQHTELQRAVNGRRLETVGEVVLTRYAPVWKRYPSPVEAHYQQLDVAPVDGELVVVAWNGLSTVTTSRLPNEDLGHGEWSVDSYTDLTSARSLSYSPGADGLWIILSNGNGFISPIDEQLRQVAGSNYDHRFIAAVGQDGLAAHIVGMTDSGNWRLAYYDEEGVRASGIYWPYQVRSFDAERLDGYDIIVMETDLPPIDDFTVQGVKTTPTYQRVQGMVVFKYDRYNHVWSSHYLLDTVDNRPDRSLAHIKLTSYGDFIYATYFKNQNGIVSLCISRSVDGTSWENPVYLPELGDTSLPLSQHYPMQLARNGKYMYLVGAGGPDSLQACFRALATDYMAPAAAENTLDVTDYVSSLSVTVEAKRSASVTLGDKSISSIRYGYGLPHLNSGELIGGGMFSDVRAMRMSIRIGYNTTEHGIVYTNQFYGVVTKFKETPGLETSIMLEAQDLSVMMGAVGNSDANEWLGVSVAGDNFAPLYGDDLTGTTGLGHTVVKTGVWSGSRFASDGTTPSGLRHTCDDDEGLAISNLIPRSQNATFAADVDFYCGIDMPVKLAGASSDAEMDGREYAGLGFRMKDQYNGWWVRITPRNDYRADFQLMLRHSETRSIPGVGGAPDTTETYFVDYAVPGASGTSSAMAGYDDYYVGKVVVRALYSRISVRHMLDTGLIETLLIHEPVGMGDREFIVDMQDITYPKPELEDGRVAAPFTSGYLAYIAKGTGIYVDHGTDELVESAITVADLEGANIFSHGSENYTPQFVNTDARYVRDSAQSVGAVTQCGHWQESGFKYEIGRGSIGSPNPTGEPLGLGGVTSLKFKADVWIDSGQDDLATIRAKAKVWYRGGSANSTPVEYTTKQVWNSYEAIIENPNNNIIDGITFFFYDPNSRVETEPTVYYVDNIKVMYKDTQDYIYFGNSVACNDEHCLTVEDAQRTLYAYAGQHNLTFDNLFELGPSSSSETVDLTGVDYFSVPFVADFQITSDYLALYPLATDIDNRPIVIEINSGNITCSVQTRLLGEPVRIANWSGSAKGRVRVVVNTLSSDGLVYSQDSSLVKDWLTILVYLSDIKILSGVFPIYPDSVFGSRLLWGSENGTMSFDSLRVSVANRVISAFSIDPGETSSNPLGRLLGVSSLAAIATPNGGLRIKRAVLSPSTVADWTLPPTARQAARDIDLMPVSHVRYTAARDDSDVFIKRARAVSWAHIFNKRDDANAITSDEMEFGSDSIVAVTRRNMRSIELALTYHPLLEVDDTVGQTTGDLYLVDAMSMTLSSEGSGVPAMLAKYKLSGDWHSSQDPDDALAGDWYGSSGGGGGGGEEPPIDPYYLYLAALGLDGSQSACIMLSGYTQRELYTLHRSSDGYVYEPVHAGASKFIVDTGLAYGVTYHYRASSPNFDGSLVWSGTVQITLEDRPILDYTFLQATPVESAPSVLLAWNDSEFAQVGFSIERSVNPNLGFQQIDATSNLYYVDESSEYDTTYYYRIRVYDSNSNSEFSNIVMVTTSHEPTHELVDSGTVAMAFVMPSTTTVVLAWSDSTFLQTEFELQHYTPGDNGLVFEHLAWATAEDRAYTDIGLEWDTVYVYRVRPVNAAGVGRWSNTVSVRTPVESAASPNTVLIARAVPDSQNVYLAWSDSTFDEDGYSVERAETVDSFQVVIEMATHLTLLTDYAPDPNTLYYYRVRPYNGAGYGAYSNVVAVVTSEKPYFPPPPPPLRRIPVLSASQVDGQYSIALEWVGDVAGYIIQRSPDGSAFSELTLVSGFDYVDDLPAVPATYWYRVCAYNGNGAGPWSNIVGVSLTVGITLTGSVQEDLTASLAWTGLPIAVSSYDVQGMLSTDTEWALVGSVDGQTLSYVTSELTGGYIYLYRIVATPQVGEPLLSNIVTLEVEDTEEEQHEWTFPSTPVLDNFNRADSSTLGSNWQGLSVSRWDETEWVSYPRIAENQFAPWELAPEPYWTAPAVGAYWLDAQDPDCETYITISSQIAVTALSIGVRCQFDPITNVGTAGYFLNIVSDAENLAQWLVVTHTSPMMPGMSDDAVAISPTSPMILLELVEGDKLGLRALGNLVQVYHNPVDDPGWSMIFEVEDNTYQDAGHLSLFLRLILEIDRLDDFGGGVLDDSFPHLPVYDRFNRANQLEAEAKYGHDGIDTPDDRWGIVSTHGIPYVYDNLANFTSCFELLAEEWHPEQVVCGGKMTPAPTQANQEIYATFYANDELIATHACSAATITLGVRSNTSTGAGYELNVILDPEIPSVARLMLTRNTDVASSPSNIITTLIDANVQFESGARFGVSAVGNLISVYRSLPGGGWITVAVVLDSYWPGAGDVKMAARWYRSAYPDLSRSEWTLDDVGGGGF